MARQVVAGDSRLSVSGEGNEDSSRTLIAALSDPAVYGPAVDSVHLVETHISWVLLTGEFAYKIKRPVSLPFVDFSTLESRHHFCDEELRLNRRLAPELYLEVLPIGGTPHEPRLGWTPAIEYAVKMVEFPSSARLDRVIADGELVDVAIEAFAERIAAFHRGLKSAPADSGFGAADTVRRVVAENLEQAIAVAAVPAESCDELRAFLRDEGARLESVLEARKRSGAIREGHGDLHLENVIDWRGELVAFDALEFDAALRWIDTIDEAAFLTMDLLAHARPDLAFRFLNRYLEAGGDYAGLALLRYYMTHRALVRAKVRALAAEVTQPTDAASPTRPYADLVRTLCDATRPVLVITHGLSGSGKTTWTSALLAALPALRLRSDIFRKRHAGIGELESSHSPVGGGLYTASRNAGTYVALAAAAAEGLKAGLNVIVDAAFLRGGDRGRFGQLAEELGVSFRILDFHASPDTLRSRIVARHAESRDPSEASLAVLDRQLAESEPLDRAELAHAIGIDTETASPAEAGDLVARVLES